MLHQINNDCPDCKGAGWVVDRRPEANLSLMRCHCQNDAVVAKLRDTAATGGLNPDQTFSSFVGRFAGAPLALAKRYADSLSGILYLHGQPGVGKTHLANAIGNAAIDTGKSVVFAVVPVFLREARASFSSESKVDSFSATLDKMSKCGVLILDDFGSERATDWSAETLFQIINDRYQKNRPTVITLNFAPDVDRYDMRLRSRFSDTQASLVVAVDAADYRKRPAHERMRGVA